jgi:tetratricopeptide (TPR) repeat protein
VLALHHQLYPATSFPSKSEDMRTMKEALEPLRPDRLGEDLVGQHLAQFPHDWELLGDLLVQVEGMTARADPVTVRQCLLVLTAAAARHEATSVCLFAILGKYPRLAECAPEPTVRLVTERAPLDLAEVIEGALPENAELVRPARDLARRLYACLAPDCRPELRAGRLLALSNRVSHAGDDREALTLIKESVDIYGQLAKAEPPAYLEHLAVALHTLGDRLADSGNLSAGIEAAREGSLILMNLADADIRRLPLLAGSLHNLVHHYGRLGDRQSALELALQAADIYRNLEAEVGGPFTSPLGQALNTLSVAMAEAGDRQGALAVASEAVEIYRRLADASPATYLPPLANSLNNLGLWFMGLGEHGRARPALHEAIEIYDGIAEREPAAYLPTLAQVLNNLGASLVTAGKYENALDPIQRAVYIRRRLADVDPARLPGLASSLINLSGALSGIGDEAAAIEPSLEATQIYHYLTHSEPAYLHQLAGALNNLGTSWARLGQPDAALETTHDAVSIRKHLVETEPAHRPDLAQALLVAAWVRGSYGMDLEQAVSQIDEAIEIYADLADQVPDVFSASLQSAYRLRDDIVGRVGEAVASNDADQPDG